MPIGAQVDSATRRSRQISVECPPYCTLDWRASPTAHYLHLVLREGAKLPLHKSVVSNPTPVWTPFPRFSYFSHSNYSCDSVTTVAVLTQRGVSLCFLHVFLLGHRQISSTTNPQPAPLSEASQPPLSSPSPSSYRPPVMNPS